MKVLGKEKDYYDSALDYSSQEQQEWFRDIKIYALNDEMSNKDLYKKLIDFKNKIGLMYFAFNNAKHPLFSNWKNSYSNKSMISSGFIAFSGKIYPFVKLTDDDKETEVFYDHESLLRYLVANDSAHILDEGAQHYFKYEFGCFVGRRTSINERIKKFFETKNFPDTTEFHIDVNSPLVIFDEHLHKALFRDSYFTYGDKYRSSTNRDGFALFSGRLRDYQFIKVLDPHSFVQELEMFMGNVLLKRDPEPVFTDKDKIQSHGFDEKISFRKRK